MNHVPAFKVRVGPEAKKSDSMKLPENVSRNRKNDYADVCPLLAPFDFLQAHLFPILQPFTFHPSVCKAQKENADLDHLKHVPPPSLATGMVRFFVHSLKGTV